ncbi:MAG: glycosyltransferase family 2 protein [Burkholderiales bacterium]|nr:glycosyltransferase family 2 protein [Burkholderiales bacterium]
MLADDKLPLSIVIISFNAEKLIGACLESAGFAAELIVVDSSSDDATVAIAQRAGAKVVQHAWRGFGPQKQFAVHQARYDWVLCLDTDERVSDELKQSIRAVLQSAAHKAYGMPRRNRFMGRWLKHGEGYPDWSVRLFDRRYARWSDDAVHEKVITTQTVGRLSGDLLHESAEDLASYLGKQNRYTTLQAAILFDEGVRISTARAALSPLARFIKFYFFKLGLLDGLPGLTHISIGCFNSFMKYMKLLELQRKRGAV